MKRKTLASVGLILLASLSIAALLAYSTRWYLAIFGLIPLLSGLLGVLMFILAVILYVFAKIRRSPGLRGRGNILLLAGLFFLMQLVYLPLARSFRDREVSRAQEFIEMLIPRLEAYRDQHGAYPAAVASILDEEAPLPPLLRLSGDFPRAFDNRDFYFQRGTTYGFRFVLPDGFIGFDYEYCCGPKGEWTVTD